MANKKQFECLCCGNLFLEPTEQELKDSDVQEIFRTQYCSKLCENEDLLHMESNKLPATELAFKTIDETFNDLTTKIIAGGFKIRP